MYKYFPSNYSSYEEYITHYKKQGFIAEAEIGKGNFKIGDKILYFGNIYKIVDIGEKYYTFKNLKNGKTYASLINKVNKFALKYNK